MRLRAKRIRTTDDGNQQEGSLAERRPDRHGTEHEEAFRIGKNGWIAAARQHELSQLAQSHLN
jgi:hypothetical protein